MKPKSYKNNQWQRMGNRWFIRPFKIRDLPVFILLVLVTAFLCVIAFPVAATVETQHREHLTFVNSLVKPHPNPLPFDKLRASLGKESKQESCFSSGMFAKLRCSPQHIATLGVSTQNPTAQTQDLLQQGKVLYEAGQFAEAVKVLQQAVKSYGSQGNELRQAVALSNLALADQKLGNLTPAQQAITDSLKLLEKSSNSQNLQVLAPILDIQGSIQLDLGQAEQALNTWQRAEVSYKQLGDQNGIRRDRINSSTSMASFGILSSGFDNLDSIAGEATITT